MNPTYDLNFGVPKEVYYTFVGAYFTNNNLYNRFHANYINNIVNKNSKIETKYLWLSPKDINTFDFRKKYFIDGAYYIVNQIIDYNPLNLTSTQVELIKLLEPNPFTPTSFLISSTPGISSGLDVDVATPSNSLRLGNNVINQGENCIAVGNNIFIPKTASNIVVFGDNVTVEDNASGLTYINGILISPFSQGSQRTISVDDTVTLSDDIIYIDCTSGDVTIQLPNPLNCFENGISKEYTIVRISDSIYECGITSANDALVIGEQIVYLQTQYDSITLFTDGVEWFIK